MPRPYRLAGRGRGRAATIDPGTAVVTNRRRGVQNPRVTSARPGRNPEGPERADYSSVGSNWIVTGDDHAARVMRRAVSAIDGQMDGWMDGMGDRRQASTVG